MEYHEWPPSRYPIGMVLQVSNGQRLRLFVGQKNGSHGSGSGPIEQKRSQSRDLPTFWGFWPVSGGNPSVTVCARKADSRQTVRDCSANDTHSPPESLQLPEWFQSALRPLAGDRLISSRPFSTRRTDYVLPWARPNSRMSLKNSDFSGRLQEDVRFQCSEDN